jgi:Zn-dependent protease
MIVVAGSTSNLLLSFLVLLLAWISGYPVSGAVALAEPLPGLALLLSGISIMMAVFNLLPAPPLDGWLLARLALGYECSLRTCGKTLIP